MDELEQKSEPDTGEVFAEPEFHRPNEEPIPFYDGVFVHCLKRSIDFMLVTYFRIRGGPDRNPTKLQRWCRKNEFIGWPW